MHPFLFLLGYRRLRFPRSMAAQVLNDCSELGLVYRDPQFQEDQFTLLCSGRSEARLRERYPALEGERFGLPSVLARYRRRPGIWIGICLSALLVWGSGQVVWQIRVEGNRETEDREIVELLATCGMEVGDRISGLHTAALENRMLLESPTISWISINLIGTVAEVEVREILPTPPEESYAAANLVASRSGVIQWMEDVRGNVAVGVGDVVGEGDLLVGGLYAPEGGSLRYTVARGRVIAQTQRSFEVFVPFRYEKKTYAAEIQSEKYLIFFKKEVKIFSNLNKIEARCDTIETEEHWTLPGGWALPVGVRTVRYPEYRIEEGVRDEETVVRLAYESLRLQMEGEVPRGTLQRKNVTEEWTEEGLYLRCQAEFLENIAQIKEIEVDGATNRKN